MIPRQRRRLSGTGLVRQWSDLDIHWTEQPLSPYDSLISINQPLEGTYVTAYCAAFFGG